MNKKKIFKYLLTSTIEVPVSGIIVHTDGSFIWVEFFADDTDTKIIHTKIVGTGQEYDVGWRHLHTYKENQYVWHILYKEQFRDNS